MKMKLKNLRNLCDAAIFLKVLSAGLVVAGYAFLSVWCCNWLLKNDYPKILAFLVIPVIIIFGIWQGYLFLKNNGNNKK